MRCWRPEGHFLGDLMIRTARHPVKEMTARSGPLFKAVSKKKGASVAQRVGSLRNVSSLLGKTVKDQRVKEKDPLAVLGERIAADKKRLERIEREAKEEIQAAVDQALQKAAEQAGSDTP
jgi:hypothetical protein